MYPGTSFEMASDWTNCDHMNTSFEGNDGLIRPWGVDYTQVNSQLVHGQFNNIILRWSGLARISYPRWPVPMLQNVDECKVDKVDRIWKPVWKRLWPTDLACINIFEFLVWLRDRRIFYKGHVNLPQSFPFALSFDALWRFWRSSAFVSRIPRWSKMNDSHWLMSFMWNNSLSRAESSPMTELSTGSPLRPALLTKRGFLKLLQCGILWACRSFECVQWRRD